MNDFLFVVGITGRHKVGKTVLASTLSGEIDAYFHGRQYRPTLTSLHFASPVKEIVRVLVGEEPDKEKTYVIDNHHYTGRQLLEMVGAKAFDDLLPRVWSSVFVDKLNKITESFPLVIVDDVRFKDQAECCDYLVVLEQSGNKREFLPSERDHGDLYRWEGDKSIVLRSGDSYTPSIGDVAMRIGRAWEDLAYVKKCISEAYGSDA